MQHKCEGCGARFYAPKSVLLASKNVFESRFLFSDFLTLSLLPMGTYYCNDQYKIIVLMGKHFLR